METIKFVQESPSLVSTPRCPALETYAICEVMCFARVVQIITVADHLDNAGFNTITKSSQLELINIINQEKTPLQMDITAAVLSLSLYRIILTYLRFMVIVFKCVYCL